MLERLGRFCARHHWVVIAAWVVVVVAAVAGSVVAGGEESNSFTLPGTQAQEAADVLDEQFPQQSGARAQVAFRAKGSSTIADQADQVNDALAGVKKLSGVESVSDPFVPDSSCTISDANPLCSVSKDGTIAYANVLYKDTTSEVGIEGADDLQDTAEKFETSQLEVLVGGDLLVNTEPIDTGSSEEIGIVAAIIVLLITLGAVAAMGIPIISALVGVGTGLAVISLLANFLTIPAVAPAGAVMIGLGVGIDYSLFIVGRHKSGLAQGLDPIEAATKSIVTSGRAVVTAGSTVIVALLGLAVFQVPAVSVIALAIAVVVVISIVAAVTLLPALCGLFGQHIEWGRLRFVHPDGREGKVRRGIRWIRSVIRVPAVSALLAVIALLVIAIPSLGMRLGPADATDSPEGSPERETYDLIAEGFGPGFNSPFLGVIEVTGGETAASSGVVDDVGTLLSDVASTKDVAIVSPSSASLEVPQIVDGMFNSAQNTAIFSIVADSSATSERTPELVNRLRDDVIPKATGGTELDVLIGGTSASYVDLDDRISDRLVLFIGVVILISFVILGAVFRSVAIPIKAAIFNLLAIFAAYGVLVAVFQWGWLASVIGVDQRTPIISYLAPVVFAVLFGLSMDYEVYTVSRAHEEYVASGDPAEAVRSGIGSAARMVVAAATIMFFVFFAFVLSPSIVMKMFGLGLAFAILIDAFIIRMILLPAVLRLLGRAAWWPGNRHLERVGAPGPKPAPEPAS